MLAPCARQAWLQRFCAALQPFAHGVCVVRPAQGYLYGRLQQSEGRAGVEAVAFEAVGVDGLLLREQVYAVGQL